MLKRVIEQFGLQVRSINEVEDSHSSTVYKCNLHNEETIFIKIPYTKLKFQREYEAYKILKIESQFPKCWTIGLVMKSILAHFSYPN